MSFETSVEIVLAALAVILSAVTVVVAVAGLAIAVVGIWGIKEIKKIAERKAQEAVHNKIAEYPKAASFLELYRNLQAQLHDFKVEYDLWQKRSEEANTILGRLKSDGDTSASNSSEADSRSTDKVSAAITESYPGEEAGSNDDNDGKSSNDSSNDSTNPR